MLQIERSMLQIERSRLNIARSIHKIMKTIKETLLGSLTQRTYIFSSSVATGQLRPSSLGLLLHWVMVCWCLSSCSGLYKLLGDLPVTYIIYGVRQLLFHIYRCDRQHTLVLPANASNINLYCNIQAMYM